LLWLSERARARAARRSEHDDVLGERNRALEDAAAARIPDLVGPLLAPGVAFEAAAAETLRRLRAGGASLRRPVLMTPDGRFAATAAFILADGESLVIRDVRLAHRPERRRENRVRLAFAGWLARQLTGRPVSRLELVNGLGGVVEVAPEPDEALAALAERA